jgi:DHA1 family bicyclomycin/chloramphenicol resistance-like MFS transporter
LILIYQLSLNIQSSLAATSLEVQQTLTAYMLSFAFMTLWHGALSDAFGRRNVILAALAISLSPVLVARRYTAFITCGDFVFCKAFGRCGMVVGRQ